MKKRVYAYLHTHWDREWYRDKEDFNLRFLDVFDVVLDELKNGNAPFFYLDGQTIAILDYLKYRKNRKQEIVDLIKNKKLAIGPYFVSADTYLINFCSMLKNLEIGMNISKDFSQKEFIAYLSDVFGISNSVFEALKLKNIDKALIWRGVNPEKIQNNCNFIKNNIKTTWLSQGYFNDFFHSDVLNIEGIKKYLDKISKYSPNNCLLPIGADHLGILKNAKEKIKEANKKLKDYEIILTSPFEYFKNEKYSNITKEIEFLDNSHTYILQGVYSARIPQKIKNAEVQNNLSRIIEPLNFFLEDKYFENIDYIYETLIKNHAHDGIYGCSLDSVHKAIDSRLHTCECTLNALLMRLVGNFKTKHNLLSKSDKKIGLFNLSNSNNIHTVKIRLPYILENSQVISQDTAFLQSHLNDIYKVPVTEEIEKHYTQLVEISSCEKLSFSSVNIKKPENEVVITKKKIENKKVGFFIKNNKMYVLNKKTNEKYEIKLTDIADIGDTYNFAPKGKRCEIELLNSEILTKGVIQSTLRLFFKNIKLDVCLKNKSDFVEFFAEIDNKKRNHKLQLNVFLKDNISSNIAQDTLGVVERICDYNYDMQQNMPAERPVELKTNSFPMQNFVNAQNLILLTKGLHEYEIYKNELRICLLRCIGTISNPKNPARSIPAGPNLLTPDAQCIGKIKLNFAISFGNHKKAFNILDEFMENYVAIDGINKENLKIEFLKLQKDEYFYGISENKKIIYNIKNKKVSLI